MPADLRLRRGHHRCVGRSRKELRAEADAENRLVQVEDPLDEERLLAQPRVAVVLVGVHRAAEDEDRAVVVDRPRRRLAPGEAPLLEVVPTLPDDLAEHTRPRRLPVDHGEDVHGANSSCPCWSGSIPPVASIPPSSRSSRRISALRGA